MTEAPHFNMEGHCHILPSSIAAYPTPPSVAEGLGKYRKWHGELLYINIYNVLNFLFLSSVMEPYAALNNGWKDSTDYNPKHRYLVHRSPNVLNQQ